MVSDTVISNTIYFLRSRKSFNYVSTSTNKLNRIHTSFLEYAVWFETKDNAEKACLEKFEWIDSGYKWWHEWENEKYEANRRVNLPKPKDKNNGK